MKAVRLYAQVLVDVLSAPDSKHSTEGVLRELNAFSKLGVESPLMLKVFDSPVMTDEDKSKTLKAFSQKLDISQLSEKFLSLLIKRNRLESLPAILTEIESIQAQKDGGLIGEVVSATPLDAGTVLAIAQAISKKMNKKVKLKEKVDPSLIAGLRVSVGGTTYDGSVRAKLDRVKESFQ
jgi:F-type H+-transporting ATPase subunit delta